MSGQRNRLDFSGQRVYVGIDVSLKSWSVTILTAQAEHKTFSQPPRAEVLVNYLQRTFPGAEYLCVYEAGYCGFWPHRALTAGGLRCLVVHPADVPTTGGERRRRRDAVDSRKLARALRSQELSAIYIPSQQAQEDRGLVRLRTDLVKKQTRCKNQIMAQLRVFGYELPAELKTTHWSRAFLLYLRELAFTCTSGRQALDALLDELDHWRELILKVTRQIRDLAGEDRYRDSVELLRTIPGISILSAMILLTELVELSRFRSFDHLCSYVGLVPDEDSSGEVQIITGLTRRRNRRLRGILIECAWVAVRKDPALLLKFEQLTSGGQPQKKNQAIVRIARKLLNRIRHVLVTREPYALGLTA